MSKFYKWLKDKNEEIYWYVVGTAMSRDSGACVIGWVFGGSKGEPTSRGASVTVFYDPTKP